MHKTPAPGVQEQAAELAKSLPDDDEGYDFGERSMTLHDRARGGFQHVADTLAQADKMLTCQRFRRMRRHTRGAGKRSPGRRSP
jgi:hypothetical protein